MMMRRLAALIVMMVSGCVPAITPAPLAHTPGAPVVVTENRYNAGVFSAMYPDGWRVITSPAGAMPSVIFASPDGCALIVLGVEPVDVPAPSACADGAYRTEMREIEAANGRVYAGMSAPDAQWDEAMRVFEAVVESVG